MKLENSIKDYTQVELWKETKLVQVGPACSKLARLAGRTNQLPVKFYDITGTAQLYLC